MLYKALRCDLDVTLNSHIHVREMLHDNLSHSLIAAQSHLLRNKMAPLMGHDSDSDSGSNSDNLAPAKAVD